MKRTLCMLLVAVLALCPAAFTQQSAISTPRPTLRPDSLDYWRSQLHFSTDPHKIDMDEVAASLAWVMAQKQLPDYVRDQCVRQINNQNKDMVGVLKWKQDVAPSKRVLCM